MMKQKMGALALCGLLACAPVAGMAQELKNDGGILSQALAAVETLTKPEGELKVQASARVVVTPDTATVNLGMSVVREELSQAQEEANAIVNTVVEELKKLGIAPGAITTSNYGISPQRDYANGDGTNVTGYYVSNSITVRVDDFSLLDTVIDTAVTAGVNEVYGVTFDVKERGVYYRQALANAVEAAQEKAELLAQASGVELLALRDVTESSSMDGGYYYANTADRQVSSMSDGGTDIQGGELGVYAQVELVYSCKPAQVADE